MKKENFRLMAFFLAILIINGSCASTKPADPQAEPQAEPQAKPVVISEEDMVITNNELTKYNGTAEYIIIPDNLGITTIGEKAFAGSSIVSIKIPEGVTGIGYNAFTLCAKLENVELPSTLKVINTNRRGRQMGTFMGCPLPTLKIPASVTDLGNWSGWPNHTIIEVEDKSEFFTSIDGVLFNKDVTRLLHYPSSLKSESYTVPSSVKEIEQFSFQSSENLRSVILPQGLASIRRMAFTGSGIRTINLPDTLNSFGSLVFNECPNLIKLIIPEGIMTIVNTNSFTYCPVLESVELPSNVEIIEPKAFIGCPNLKRIVLPGNVDIKANSIISNTGEDVTDSVNFVFY